MMRKKITDFADCRFYIYDNKIHLLYYMDDNRFYFFSSIEKYYTLSFILSSFIDITDINDISYISAKEIIYDLYIKNVDICNLKTYPFPIKKIKERIKQINEELLLTINI